MPRPRTWHGTGICSSFTRGRLGGPGHGEVTMADEAVIYTRRPRPGVPLRALGRAGDRRLPDRSARRQGGRDPGDGGPGHRAADRVRPRDRRGDDRHRRGRARGHRDLVVLGAPSAAQAPAGTSPSPGCWCSSTAPTPRSSTSCRRRQPDEVSTGMRVRPEFAPEAERVGHVKDISHFVAVGRCVVSEREPVTMMAATTQPRLRLHRRRGHEQEPARATSRASSSGSAAPSARRSTSPHGAPARPTACPPTRSSSSPTPAP